MNFHTSEHAAQPREILPSPSTAETIHVPRIFAEEACLDRCSGLAGVVGCATLKAVISQDRQFDVVCGGKTRFSCGARIVNTGHYTTSGHEIENSDELFLISPVRYVGGGGPADDIQQAIDSGLTAHSPNDIKRL